MVSGIFGNIGNLFKPTAEIERERRQRKRKLLRGVETAVEKLTEAKRQREKESDRCYQQGKKLLAVGREAEARSQFAFARLNTRSAEMLTKQVYIWQNRVTQIEVAGSLKQAAICLKGLIDESNLGNLEDLTDEAFDSAQGVSDVLGEVDKSVNRELNRDLNRAEAGEDNESSAVDAMMEQARNEVAAENGLSAPGGATPAPGQA